MTPEIVGIAGLVLVFALSMWRGVNMGAIALVAAFALGTLYFGVDAAEVAAGFPGNLLVTLVGVTFFFGLARANGTVQHVVDSAVRLVRGRRALIPWVFFLLAALITGSGALSAATNSILIPVGLAFAARYRISPLLVGLSILNGTNAGGFSPIAVYFTIIDGVLAQSGITVDPIPVFLLTFACGLVLNIVAFFLLGGRALLAEGRGDDAETEAVGTPEPWTARQILTIVLFAGILGLGLLAGIDVGFLALSAAVVLALVFPSDLKEGMEGIGWGVVLLIGGIVAYITVLQNAGVVDSLAGSVSGIGVPLAAGLLMLYVAGAVSAFASTNAMFGALVPLAAPLLTGGDLPVLGFVVALSVAASSSDASPFSTGGALVVANTEEAKRTRTFKGLMAWGMSMVAVTPVLVWLGFLVL